MVSNKVEIRQFYNNYRPPRYAFKTVRKLLSSVPDKYAQGLECVVLTNQSGHPRRDRLGKVTSRKRRLPQSRVLGRYHPARHGTQPWIELFVDNIEARASGPPGWFPLVRQYRFRSVLYHELGHHIHATIAPEYRDKEDVADSWVKKLVIERKRRH